MIKNPQKVYDMAEVRCGNMNFTHHHVYIFCVATLYLKDETFCHRRDVIRAETLILLATKAKVLFQLCFPWFCAR